MNMFRYVNKIPTLIIQKKLKNFDVASLNALCLMSRSMGSHNNMSYGFTLYMELFFIKFHYFDHYINSLTYNCIEMSPPLLIS